MIVAPRFEHSTLPAELIALLRGGGERPERVLVFSDQLTSPLDASVAVQAPTGVQFLSTIEAILHVRYSYRLRIWGGPRDPARVHASTPEEVFAALLSYFAACEQLGDDWLQRDAQAERALAHRAALAQRELRYFTSVAFHALRSASVNDPGVASIDRIDSLSRQIAATQKAA